MSWIILVANKKKDSAHSLCLSWSAFSFIYSQFEGPIPNQSFFLVLLIERLAPKRSIQQYPLPKRRAVSPDKTLSLFVHPGRDDASRMIRSIMVAGMMVMMLVLRLVLLLLLLAIGRRRSSVAVILAIERFILHRHRVVLALRCQSGRAQTAHCTTPSKL